jgi:hypothetical protein
MTISGAILLVRENPCESVVKGALINLIAIKNGSPLKS